MNVVHVTITMPDELVAYVTRIAKEQGLPFSDAVCAIIEEMKSNAP